MNTNNYKNYTYCSFYWVGFIGYYILLTLPHVKLQKLNKVGTEVDKKQKPAVGRVFNKHIFILRA